MASARPRLAAGLGLLAVLVFVLAGSAAAHPGGGSRELTVVSHLDIAVGPGHITDVWAHGNFAYLGSFDEPTCSLDFTGVHIVDISDPASPSKVAFIRSSPGARVNDVKVAHIETRHFSGDLLVNSQEPCDMFHPRQVAEGEPPVAADPEATGGIDIWDVSDPRKPRQLHQNFIAAPVHNTFIYQHGDRAFILVVDDFGPRDLHIVEITNPSAPRILATVGAPDWPERDNIGVGEVFLHDVWAQEVGGRVIAYLSYWDAGLILLDVTDPARPVFLGDSEYLSPDPLSGQLPEGNSHAAVPTSDGRLVVMGDEDFTPFRPTLTVDTGPFAGDYRATEGAFTQPIAELPDEAMNGPTTFVRLACDPGSVPPPAPATLAPGEEHIAVIERGVCRFDTKIPNVAAQGYGGAIVFNRVDVPDELITMGGDEDKGVIPAIFVTRFTGFSVLGIGDTSSPPDLPLPEPGTAGEHATVRVVFDGWGYLRVLDVSDPANMAELGQFATAGVFDPATAGDPKWHTIHNVMMIDDRRVAASWYAEGMRVIDLRNPARPREVAHFLDPSGNDFWGVYVHRHPNGQTYILGSDRDDALWLFATP